MKKRIAVILTLLMLASLIGCGSQTDPLADAGQQDCAAPVQQSVPDTPIQNSPDKYTWYIKNYVGKNCASLGYASLGGDRMDTYGSGRIRLIFAASDGAYLDIGEEDTLKQYVVTGQSVAPNALLKLTFSKDGDGNEYDNLVSTQTYEEIVLRVKRVGDTREEPESLTVMKPSPDRYTWYISDYIGRNLASCGYTSLGGDRMQKYGAAVVKLVLVSEDGAYIDPEDAQSLQGYVVTGQSVAPNTEIKLAFATDGSGTEYENLVASQNVEEIELTVKPLAG